VSSYLSRRLTENSSANGSNSFGNWFETRIIIIVIVVSTVPGLVVMSVCPIKGGLVDEGTLKRHNGIGTALGLDICQEGDTGCGRRGPSRAEPRPPPTTTFSTHRAIHSVTAATTTDSTLKRDSPMCREVEIVLITVIVSDHNGRVSSERSATGFSTKLTNGG